jgi:energy-coupling factor transporter ATP-binding protein EcfA2
MDETFITHIRVSKVRNIVDLDIPLSDHKRKHLIVTGKNGCGKTSLLTCINSVFDSRYASAPNQRVAINSSIEVKFSDSGRDLRGLNAPPRFVWVFFAAKREANFSIPQGIQKVDLAAFPPFESPSRHFIQYIVNLKAERSFAKDDNDGKAVDKIDNWFSYFESRLKDLFDAQSLELVFDRKNYDFLIKLPDQEAFSLLNLSDGYSAVMRIISDIMLRMENPQGTIYDLEGIVIIDEIETHLHVDLQKKILPFLCDFFPKIQFIVSTHSPFVLSSVENAVICDLQNRIVTEDLSGYSYDALIESYFRSDKYSDILKRKVARYEALADMPEKSDREMDEYFELKHELSNLPKYLAPELDVKLKQIELKHLS